MEWVGEAGDANQEGNGGLARRPGGQALSQPRARGGPGAGRGGEFTPGVHRFTPGVHPVTPG
eukprot:425463-Prorocentrum_minimum.AAC.1